VIIHKEDLANFGFKLNMKYKSLINLYIYGWTLKTEYKNILILTIVFSLLTIGTLQNHFFWILNLLFLFLAKNCKKKEGTCEVCREIFNIMSRLLIRTWFSFSNYDLNDERLFLTTSVLTFQTLPTIKEAICFGHENPI
jgi:hypothetical protein